MIRFILEGFLIYYMEVMKMATSTFDKQFSVHVDKADEFVKEMTRAVAPTLTKEFHSRLTYLTRESEVKNNLQKALSK